MRLFRGSLGYFGEELETPTINKPTKQKKQKSLTAKEADDYFKPLSEKEIEKMMLEINARAKAKNGFLGSPPSHIETPV